MKYIDTHAHINSKHFKNNKEEAIKEAFKNNVDKIILPGTTIEDSLSNIEFAKQNEGIYAMVGIHPSDSREYDGEYLNKIDPKNIVGIGEVGFDFYYENNPSYEVQEKCFIEHIEFALKNDLPIIIHMREAEKETFNLLSKYKDKGLKILMHSYASNKEWAKKFLEIGAFFSFSGMVTFKNANDIKEAAKFVPHDRMVVETDSPFLAPVPMRGKSNTPAYVKYTADYLSELKEDDELQEKLYQNTIKFFGL